MCCPSCVLRKQVPVAVLPNPVGCWRDMMSFARPSMLEGTLFDVARFKARGTLCIWFGC